MTTAELAELLTRLLMLPHPPVAVSFHHGTPDAQVMGSGLAGSQYQVIVGIAADAQQRLIPAEISPG